MVAAVLTAGCGEQAAQRPAAPIEGVMLGDLMPPEPVGTGTMTHFGVQVFWVDAEHAEAVRGCYANLSEGGIRFFNRQAFEANGFFAAMGVGSQVGPLNSCLRRVGARPYGQTNLTTDAGQEVPFHQIYIDNVTFSYVSAEEGKTETTIHDSDLSWSLTAHPDPTLPDRVRTRIRPVFMPRGLQYWPGAERLTDQLSHRFSEGRLDVSLREGDFVVLATQHDAIDELTPLEQLLFLHHEAGRTHLLLFVILCLRTGL